MVLSFAFLSFSIPFRFALSSLALSSVSRTDFDIDGDTEHAEAINKRICFWSVVVQFALRDAINETSEKIHIVLSIEFGSTSDGSKNSWTICLERFFTRITSALARLLKCTQCAPNRSCICRNNLWIRNGMESQAPRFRIFQVHSRWENRTRDETEEQKKRRRNDKVRHRRIEPNGIHIESTVADRRQMKKKKSEKRTRKKTKRKWSNRGKKVVASRFPRPNKMISKNTQRNTKRIEWDERKKEKIKWNASSDREFELARHKGNETRSNGHKLK